MRRASLVSRVLAALIVAGCGASPTASPPLAEVPLGCLGVAEIECRAIAAQAIAPFVGRLDEPTYVEVGPTFCAQPCPPGAVEGWLTVEFVDRPPELYQFRIDAVGATLTATENHRSQVEPQSPPLDDHIAMVTLGHCGLASGIDVDGSFWDPVGVVDPTVSNAAAAVFTVTSATTAILETEGGAAINMVRHRGPKTLPGCD